MRLAIIVKEIGNLNVIDICSGSDREALHALLVVDVDLYADRQHRQRVNSKIRLGFKLVNVDVFVGVARSK